MTLPSARLQSCPSSPVAKAPPTTTTLDQLGAAAAMGGSITVKQAGNQLVQRPTCIGHCQRGPRQLSSEELVDHRTHSLTGKGKKAIAHTTRMARGWLSQCRC
jgi:hypothetical protein